MSPKIILILLSCVMLSVSGCRKCIECTKFPSANDTVKLCKKDYASDDSYNSAYRNLSAAGYKCE